MFDNYISIHHLTIRMLIIARGMLSHHTGKLSQWNPPLHRLIEALQWNSKTFMKHKKGNIQKYKPNKNDNKLKI